MEPSAAYLQLEFREYPEYLHARVTAFSMGASAAMSYLAEVFLECARLRKKKLLLERVSPCAMPIDELFSTMDYIVSLGTDTRIAFLNSHDSAAENLKPVVDYGADRGGNYGYFEISDDAVRWLMLGID